MKSTARVAAEYRDGRTVLTNLRSDPPISLRPTKRGVAIVGSAAGPVGGDDVGLEIDVGVEASLRIEPVAASLLFPGLRGEQSTQDITIRVHSSGHLEWQGQPMVSIVGSRHVQRVHIELAASATLDFLDWIVMGRTREPGGHLDTELRVVRGGRVLLHQRQVYDPELAGSTTSAGLGGFDEVKQHLRVGPSAAAVPVDKNPTKFDLSAPLASDAHLHVSVSKRDTRRSES